MISATSENEQATIITLTETELEGIYGGWGHHGGGEHFSFRGGEHFSFRSSERFSFRSSERFSFRFHDEDSCG